MKFKHVSTSEDYAVVTIGDMEYYFGYEIVYCPTCNSYFDSNNTCECNFAFHEWAFKAKNMNTNKVDYMRVADYDWENTGRTLLELIARYKEKI